MIIWRPSSLGICSTLARSRDLGLDLLEDVHGQMLMRHLAAAEAHGDLDLVALVEEFADLAHLDVVVVVVDAGAHLDLLDLDHPLLLAGGVGLLLRLVLELAVVEDLADRRRRGRSDLDEVQAGFLGPGQGVAGGDHPDHVALGIDQTNLADVDPEIDAVFFLLLRSRRHMCRGSSDVAPQGPSRRCGTTRIPACNLPLGLRGRAAPTLADIKRRQRQARGASAPYPRAAAG